MTSRQTAPAQRHGVGRASRSRKIEARMRRTVVTPQAPPMGNSWVATAAPMGNAKVATTTMTTPVIDIPWVRSTNVFLLGSASGLLPTAFCQTVWCRNIGYVQPHHGFDVSTIGVGIGFWFVMVLVWCHVGLCKGGGVV